MHLGMEPGSVMVLPPPPSQKKKQNTRILGNDKEPLNGSRWCLYMFGFELTLIERFRNIFPENKHRKKAMMKVMMTHIGPIKVDENCFGKMEPYHNSCKIPTSYMMCGARTQPKTIKTQTGEIGCK